MSSGLRVGQRVKFTDQHSATPGLPARGRITYRLEPDLFQVIPDGKTFGLWFLAEELRPERESFERSQR